MGKTKAVKPVTTKKKTAAKADIGLIGIAVMGENLVLNMESKGFKIAVFNRTVDKVDNFVKGRGKGKNIVGCHTVEELVDNLATPRKIMLMVKAGKPVDDFIEQLIPLLDKGDIIIDGGNSHFPDTIRRTKYLESKKLLFIGTGVSGGEEGALLGPSIMPGGSPKAWPAVKPIFQAISAKVDDGAACCEWVGSDGAGHYVKTVHNGIEYGDMQMICEAYTMMKNLLGMSAKEMQKVFAEWNKAELDSYLIDITANILKVVDSKTKKPLVDMILDTAGQKGTGKWTSMSALDLGAPSPTIAEAVFARCVSAIKEERVAASKILKGPKMQKFSAADKNVMIDKIRQALYASKICSYAQGFQLLALAQEEYGWKLNFGEIALMWRGGCIIRAKFLGDIKDAFEKDPKLANLLLASFFKKAVNDCQSAWRDVVAAAAVNGIPVPAFSSALSYYDSYRSAVLPANLLQAQRDYFGAHTFERTDEPRGKFFHHEWTETSGSTTSTTYNA